MKGPQGQKRPRDINQNAVLAARIATGEAKEVIERPKRAKRKGVVKNKPKSV